MSHERIKGLSVYYNCMLAPNDREHSLVVLSKFLASAEYNTKIESRTVMHMQIGLVSIFSGSL